MDAGRRYGTRRSPIPAAQVTGAVMELGRPLLGGGRMWWHDLAFHARVRGFGPADDIAPVEVARLG